MKNRIAFIKFHQIDEILSQLNGKIIQNRNICIESMPDINLYNLKPKFECETLFLNECNKNFIYYNLNNKIFPYVKSVYLRSHPCEYAVIRQFSISADPKTYPPGRLSYLQLYVHERYQGLLERWGGIKGKNIHVIDDTCYTDTLNSLDHEALSIKEKF